MFGLFWTSLKPNVEYHVGYHNNKISPLVEESYLRLNGIAAEVNKLSFLLSVIMLNIDGMATVLEKLLHKL